MRWRPLSTYHGEIEETEAQGQLRDRRYVDEDAWEDDHAQDVPAWDERARAAALSQALGRLEAATRLRDATAAARVLTNLADTEDGQWLLRQCVAAGLRDVARHIADPDLRSIGPAA